MEKGNRILIPLFLFFTSSLQMKLAAQEERTYYRTNTTYEAYQLDKVPFAMKKLTLAPTDDSIPAAGKVFYKNILKDGNLLYITTDRKGYLLTIEKPGQLGFIICPNGKDWSCYFRNKKNKDIPPDDYSNEEAALLKKAVANIIDPRVQYFYFTYSAFASKANTSFAEDSLPIIFVSPDTISVRGYDFIKKTGSLYINAGHTYLYMPDKETLVFRDPDIQSWASFYQKDIGKASKLISQEYKSGKELTAANNAISNMETGKTKNVLNNYFSGIKSKKNDSALTNSILKYWNGRWPGSPAYKVIFVDDDLHVTTNTLGVPLRRSITAWVLFKQNGQCLAQWHQYGYEALGGGSYAKELTQWKMNYTDFYITVQTQQGSEYLHSGDQFEFDCGLVK